MKPKAQAATLKERAASMFEGKTLLITGGTGSFGRAVLDRFLESDIAEIRIFSRDEKKQDDMRHAYQTTHPDSAHKITFYVGDVRDIDSMKLVMAGADYVFHAAALKQVPSCEFFPIQAVKTNILGTENMLAAATEAGVKKVVCLSTDKAAYPVNAMGMSKALMEKTMIARSRLSSRTGTVLCGTRYGNVMYSRGSVIPLFIEQIRKGQQLTVTHPDMTRFMMTLDEAVDLVIYAFKNADPGDLMVQKAKAATIQTLAEALLELFGSDVGWRTIGVRHSEKMDETLLTAEEYVRALDEGAFFRVPADARDLNYDAYVRQGKQDIPHTTFNSFNAERLDKEQLKQKLLTIPYVRLALEGVELEVM